MHSTVNIFIIVILARSSYTAQEIGDKCLLKDGSMGFCELIPRCASAQNNLKLKINPVLCGWIGLDPIVCCSDSNSKIEEKCMEYSKLNVWTTITTTTTTTDKTKVVPQFVVGGINALHSEFKHMALLGYGSAGNTEYQCGGSLISEQFVLTAAHCLNSKDLGPVSLVVLGDLDTSTELERAEPQRFTVAQTYVHPDYDYETFYNDIALLKLDRPAIYTLYVKPACLQTKYKLQYDNDLSAIGWGALNFGGSMHNHLQKVSINNLPITNCLKTYRPQPRLPRGINGTIQICGGNLKEEMDTCQGDSGGPLQLKFKDNPLMYRIVGITSFGINCGLAPGVYTRISYYVSWIENIVWSN